MLDGVTWCVFNPEWLCSASTFIVFSIVSIEIIVAFVKWPVVSHFVNWIEASLHCDGCALRQLLQVISTPRRITEQLPQSTGKYLFHINIIFRVLGFNYNFPWTRTNYVVYSNVVSWGLMMIVSIAISHFPFIVLLDTCMSADRFKVVDHKPNLCGFPDEEN